MHVRRKACAFLAYSGPFLVFIALLALAPYTALPHRIQLLLWVIIPGAAIALWSRNVLEFHPSRILGSVMVGVFVFAIWIAPDLLFPAWRSHWLFQNPISGTLQSSLPAEALKDPLSITLRVLRAVVIVPILEELFWRGWLMRWLISLDFERVPLGSFTGSSFFLVALFFALEHGPFWEVGFLAGAVYNWWIVRAKRLSDVILAHAITNACLCGFVLVTNRWEYWL
jgi:uncharacterized protein